MNLFNKTVTAADVSAEENDAPIDAIEYPYATLNATISGQPNEWDTGTFYIRFPMYTMVITKK